MAAAKFNSSIYHLRKFLHFNIQKTCFGQRRSKDSQILYLSKPTRLLNCTLFQIFTQCVYRLGLTCCICKVLQKEKQTERPIPIFLSENADCNKMMLLGILFSSRNSLFFKYTKTRLFSSFMDSNFCHRYNINKLQSDCVTHLFTFLFTFTEFLELN